MISKKTIDEIFAAVKIEEVVADFVSLKKQGQSYVGICPFHDDRNPSMHVTPRLGIYKCFVCDAKGNAVKFLMEHEKISYPEALEYLAKKYSIPIEYDHQETSEEKELRSERESLYLVNEFAEKFFMDQLRNTEEGQLMGMTYFKERGFKDSTIDKFHLGYCPSGWDAFTKEALKQGYKEDFLIKLGLTRKAANGKLFDFYRGRVIFPIHNVLGKVIGFGGRVLKKDEKTAKYFNSPESEIYHKTETLYDIYLAKKEIRNKDNTILVEGYTDVISLFESGIENAVASSGTSLTEEQVKILSRQSKNITVLYDGDRAGIKASMRGIDMLLNQGLNVRVCLLPDGEDPDSFAKQHRDSEVAEYLERNTTDFLLFKARILSQDAGNDPTKRATMVMDVLKSIASVQDNITRAFYIKECAKLFDLPEETLNGELRRMVWKKINEQPKSNTPSTGGATQQVASPEEKTYVPQIDVQKNKQQKPALDMLYEAEKGVILLLLKYGLYEINVEVENPDGDGLVFMPKRIDQFVFDELYNDHIVLTNPLLSKIYDHYAEVAQILFDQDAIKRTFILSEDPEESKFAIENIEAEMPTYSKHWQERYDMVTISTMNSLMQLEQEVHNVILLLKLRIVEKQLEFLQNEMKKQDYTEEDTLNMMSRYTVLLKCRTEISSKLNMAVSK
ncbi:MAG: DNA primase [Bacteroidales bacterium]|nr:DNA primase [Bacteroidales bacterium]